MEMNRLEKEGLQKYAIETTERKNGIEGNRKELSRQRIENK